MHIRTIPVLILILVFTGLFAGCSPVEQTATLTPTGDTMPTLVAKTVASMGTQIVASLKTQTSIESKTPIPVASATRPAGFTPQPISASATPGGPFIQVSKDAPLTGSCDSFAFLADVTIPDGTFILPGSPFKKQWAIKNTGTCTWTPEYSLVFLSGDALTDTLSVPLINEGTIAPGAMAVVAVNLTAPIEMRGYTSFWRVRNPGGQSFGAGPDRDKSLYAQIEVSSEYHFMLNQCNAVWSNNNGLMYCPSGQDTTNGSYYLVDKPQLENNLYGAASLAMVPPSIQDGKISAKFAPVMTLPGSQFKTIISCAAGRTQCNAHAVVTYQVADGPEKVLAETYQEFDGLTEPINVRLADFALENQLVRFTFSVDTNGGPEQDVIYFQDPRIEP